MASPKVSIITATWNRGHLIGKAIQSALDQSFQDWELIIVGDGPPADTEATIREWEKKDARIRYIPLAHVGRIAIVSSAGLKAARGEYVAILDDDDWWLDHEKLAKQVAFLDGHPEYIGCGTWFAAVDSEGNMVAKIKKPLTDEAIRRVALSANPIANSSSIFRREAAGYYDESLRQFADWDFWLQAGLKGKLCNLPEYALAYRMWQGGSSFANQKQNVDSALVILRRHRHHYPGYWRAAILVHAYWVYARFPLFIRKGLNGTLSRIKKFIFSR